MRDICKGSSPVSTLPSPPLHFPLLTHSVGSSVSIHPPSPTWTTRITWRPAWRLQPLCPPPFLLLPSSSSSLAQKTFCVAGAKLNFSRLPSPHPFPTQPRSPSTRQTDRQQHVIVSGMENSLMGIRLAVQGSPFALGQEETECRGWQHRDACL